MPECIAKQYKGCQSTTTESATVATESPSTALSEARSLAEQGDADAQFNLGEMYEWGKGVPQDNVCAHMWFNIAASTSNDAADRARDMVAEDMTPTQIAKAEKLASECVAKQYKDC